MTQSALNWWRRCYLCVCTAQENKTIKRRLWPRVSSKFTRSCCMIAESGLYFSADLRRLTPRCEEGLRRGDETNHTCNTPKNCLLQALPHDDTGTSCSTRARLGPLTRAANYRLLRGLGAQRHCMLSFLIKNINACRRKKKKKEDQLRRGRTDNSPVPQ